MLAYRGPRRKRAEAEAVEGEVLYCTGTDTGSPGLFAPHALARRGDFPPSLPAPAPRDVGAGEMRLECHTPLLLSPLPHPTRSNPFCCLEGLPALLLGGNACHSAPERAGHRLGDLDPISRLDRVVLVSATCSQNLRKADSRPFLHRLHLQYPRRGHLHLVCQCPCAGTAASPPAVFGTRNTQTPSRSANLQLLGS